jgi:hypothetical protein
MAKIKKGKKIAAQTIQWPKKKKGKKIEAQTIQWPK